MYQYLLYGLIVQSDIPLYNLIQTTGQPSVFICYGKINYDNLFYDSKDFFYSTDYVCFLTDYGVLAISNGDKIIIEPNSKANHLNLAAYVLGWGMAFIFTQRGYSALHCTALSINNHGFLISGISGAGKSTTALSLINRGCKFLADDIAMLNPPDSMMIIPAYPIQKVCRNIAETLNPDNLLYINEDRDKYSYYNPTEFCNTPSTLKTIISLRCADIPLVQVEEITGLNKYLRTLECLFLSEIYASVGASNDDKFRCLKLAEKIKLYIITRPFNSNTIDEITDLVLHLVSNEWGVN